MVLNLKKKFNMPLLARRWRGPQDEEHRYPLETESIPVSQIGNGNLGPVTTKKLILPIIRMSLGADSLSEPPKPPEKSQTGLRHYFSLVVP